MFSRDSLNAYAHFYELKKMVVNSVKEGGDVLNEEASSFSFLPNVILVNDLKEKNRILKKKNEELQERYEELEKRYEELEERYKKETRELREELKKLREIVKKMTRKE